MAKVLITGAAGFIGRQLARFLRDRGDDVRGLVRRESQADAIRHDGVTPVIGDVRDGSRLAAAVAEVETVYHLAGRIKACRTADFQEVNAVGTENLAKVCARRAGTPPTLLLVSTLAAGGPSSPGQLRTEQDTDLPISAYGRSKLEGEHRATKFSAQLPLTIVRPSFVFGEGDPASVSIFRAIRRFGLHLAPSLNFELSLVHVDDLVVAIASLAARGERADDGSGQTGCGCYYLASAEIVTYREFGDRIGDALGRRVRYWRVRRPTLWVACQLGNMAGRITRKPVILNSDKFRESQAAAWTCSAAKARSAIGFSPTRSVEEQIRQTATWYLENGWL